MAAATVPKPWHKAQLNPAEAQEPNMFKKQTVAPKIKRCYGNCIREDEMGNTCNKDRTPYMRTVLKGLS
jgi:hypothetical protein